MSKEEQVRKALNKVLERISDMERNVLDDLEKLKMRVKRLEDERKIHN